MTMTTSSATVTTDSATVTAAGAYRPQSLPPRPAGMVPQALPSGGAEVYGCYADAERSETHLSLFPFIMGMEAVCGRPMIIEGPLVGGPAVRGWPPVAPCCPACRSELFARRYR